MTALNLALSAIDRAIGQSPTDQQLLIGAKCRGLMVGYDARWRDAGYVTVGRAEKLVTSELYNPDTQRRSRSFTIAGKLDAICEMHGRRILFDHKSTSHDITDPNGPYWRQLVVEGQVNHYFLLQWLNGEKIDQATWDVMRKPSISPKLLKKADRQSIVSNRSYCGFAVSDESLQVLQTSERETHELYELRLASDCTNERPEWYFQRRAVPRLDAEILEYARELWEHSQEVLHVRNTGRNARNSGACMLYNSPCKFLGICSGHDTAESANWQLKQQVHNELDGLDGDGRDVLTNSRIRCFQTCRRKHYYEYELGIERLDEEEREALYFGTVWHAGLEAWFNCFRNPVLENANGDASHSPANEVGKRSASEQAELAR